jgi:hypothetical protein
VKETAEKRPAGWQVKRNEKGRFRSLSTRVYLDEKVRRFDFLAKGVWQYLLCNHHTTMLPGVYPLRETTAAEELGITLEEFRKGFSQPFREGMVEADWDAGLVWVRNAWKYEQPQNPNQVRCWRDLLAHELPECALLTRAVRTIIKELSGFYVTPAGFLNACAEHLPEPFRQPFPEGFQEPYPKPGSSTQEAVHSKEASTTASAVSSVGRRHAANGKAADWHDDEGMGDGEGWVDGSEDQESTTSQQPTPQEPNPSATEQAQPAEASTDPPAELNVVPLARVDEAVMGTEADLEPLPNGEFRTTALGFCGWWNAYRVEQGYSREVFNIPEVAQWAYRCIQEVGPERFWRAATAFLGDDWGRGRHGALPVFRKDGVWRPRAIAAPVRRLRL